MTEKEFLSINKPTWLKVELDPKDPRHTGSIIYARVSDTRKLQTEDSVYHAFIHLEIAIPTSRGEITIYADRPGWSPLFGVKTEDLFVVDKMDSRDRFFKDLFAEKVNIVR